MTSLEDLLEDFEVAFEELTSSGEDETIRRRTCRAAMGALYEVREILRGNDNSTYRKSVNDNQFGQISEGILVLRGRMTHGALDDIRPMMKLAFPGPKFFPSPYSFPGENLLWLELDELAENDREELTRRDKHKLYANHVAGHMVLPTLDIARQFYHGLIIT